MRGHSVGGFGSVTTNKVIATIAGNVFGKDVQAYPKYGSEKKGLPTTYYLTIADSHIIHALRAGARRSAVHQRPDRHPQPAARWRAWCRAGPIFMQSPYADPAEVWKRIPAENQQTIRDKKVRVYYCDMVRIAREVASRGRPADAHAGHRAARRVPAADAVRQGKRT